MMICNIINHVINHTKINIKNFNGDFEELITFWTSLSLNSIAQTQKELVKQLPERISQKVISDHLSKEKIQNKEK
jgi:hypothetical protein